jgi:predicted protein tyrosine phosphatase
MNNATAKPDLGGSLARVGGSVHVCPLSAVPEVVAGCGASHLVTCLQDEIVVDTPALIKPDFHVRLHVDDISQPMPGYTAPSEEHVAKLIDFALAWGGRGPLVIHCWAGISRSTAAALVALCALNPEAPERLIAARLRAASPTAYPNRLLIRLADTALGRGGRLIGAVEAIGRGVPAHEAAPFSLPAHFPAAA